MGTSGIGSRFDEHMYEFQFGKGPNDPKGKYPKVVKRLGKSPPQYPDEEE